MKTFALRVCLLSCFVLAACGTGASGLAENWAAMVGFALAAGLAVFAHDVLHTLERFVAVVGTDRLLTEQRRVVADKFRGGGAA